MHANTGLGARIGGGGGGAFASRSFGSFSGFRFASPFSVWPWSGWNTQWPWTTWYLYYPDYFPITQCQIGQIRLTEAQTRQLAVGQTISVVVADSCGRSVIVTLRGGDIIAERALAGAPAPAGGDCCCRSA